MCCKSTALRVKFVIMFVYYVCPSCSARCIVGELAVGFLVLGGKLSRSHVSSAAAAAEKPYLYVLSTGHETRSSTCFNDTACRVYNIAMMVVANICGRCLSACVYACAEVVLVRLFV